MDHMTLLVFNTLSTLILYESLDPKTFEVSQTAALTGAEDEDESEDAADILD